MTTDTAIAGPNKGMREVVHVEPLTAESFAPFGDVLDTQGSPDKLINQGMCGRYHDRARLDFSDGRAGISLFNAKPRNLPYLLELVERHPEGSQTFIPMSEHPFLVTVAPNVIDPQGDTRNGKREGPEGITGTVVNSNGVPGKVRAFVTRPGQAINFHRGTWHGVLTPLFAPGLFAVVDRIGAGANLEEHWFDHAIYIQADPIAAAP